MVKECGLEGIEICRKHVDFLDRSTHQQAIDDYASEEVRIVSIGVNPITGRELEDRSIFEFARLAGLSVMSVDFPIDGIPDSFSSAERLAEEYGVKLAIHNHGGRHWLGSSTALGWVLGQTSPRIGLSLDTAWAIDSRENPVDWVRRFGSRIYVLHLKDFLYSPQREPEDVIVGTGILNLPELDSALTEHGFDGEWVLEYEGDVDNPIPALRECVSVLREQMPLLATDVVT
jgi:sugar phosphate isomerase/epimerase